MADEDTETTTTSRDHPGEADVGADDHATETATSGRDVDANDDGERATDADRSTAETGGQARTEADEMEERIGSFLSLEESLAMRAGPGRASVVEAETVPASAVPADYPRTVDAGEVLALTLEHVETGQRETAYFAWPPEDGTDLERLLTAVGVEPTAFADLHGRRLLVRMEDDYLVPVVPPAGPDGTRHGLTGVLGCHLANLAVVVGTVVGAVSPLGLFLALLLINLVGMPLSTYFDGWHLKRTTDWDHAPSFWASLQMLPLVNVLTTALYLRERRRARPLDASG